MSKHTPAPWSNGANIPLTAKSCEQNGFNLIFVNRDDRSEPDANAKLIAAAPELLEALLEYDDAFHNLNLDCRDSRARMRDAVNKARAAIAKAT